MGRLVRALREPARPAAQDPAMPAFVQAVGERELKTTSCWFDRVRGHGRIVPDEVTTRTRTIRLTGTDPDLGRVQDQPDESRRRTPPAGARRARRWTRR